MLWCCFEFKRIRNRSEKYCRLHIINERVGKFDNEFLNLYLISTYLQNKLIYK